MSTAESSSFAVKSVDVGGFDVGVRSNTVADRKVVILVHGIGVSEKYFRRLADELSSRYKVISVNLPGYGETKKPSHPLSLEELADVLAQFIRQEAITNPVIIGQSMGCQIAVRLGARDSGGIDKIVLISPTVNIKERTAPLQFVRLVQDALREPFTVNRMIILDYIKFGFSRYLKTQRYMIADKIEAHLAGCAQSVLILRGENDKIAPRDWGKFLLAVAKKGSFVEVKAGPHNVHFTHPRIVADACSSFIEP